MNESVIQRNSEDFTLRLLDESGETITSYDLNIKQILKDQKTASQFPEKLKKGDCAHGWNPALECPICRDVFVECYNQTHDNKCQYKKDAEKWKKLLNYKIYVNENTGQIIGIDKLLEIVTRLKKRIEEIKKIDKITGDFWHSDNV